ncbi:nitrous oxide reductase family maturation protein NosD [Sulfuricystis multivorans]|uniref:nitrous oxide reductase family maturation protein NosD n=1 Tax=Sulfuricystis multivorans TaxID=2211108 RepID=UPI0015586FCC|nr:nitrous oxide reductase family maturation protein NosD [Sulfuricystis multivorans]
MLRPLIRLVLWLATPLVWAAPSLQALIDAAPAGSTLHVPPGVYAGPVTIDKPLVLEGGGQAQIRSAGRGTVVRISGRGVTLRGFSISGSGELHDAVDAGIQVEGHDHLIENNRIEDVLFGIHLRQAVNTVVRSNQVTGKPLQLSMRGDAIRMWHGTANRIEHNRFQRARDLTFINSQDSVIIGNQFSDGRYGMQIVFSPRLSIEDNRIERMATGIVVLYSRDVVLRGNTIAHALTGGGAGIVFKESDSGRVIGNTVLHCAVGLKVDAPPEKIDLLDVRDNRFAHNIIGLFFYGEAGGHSFAHNRFDNNLTTVAISGVGAAAANVWRYNRWDEYQGFDRDRDGIGDTPHEVWLYADRIWMETPMTTFFRNSPVLELLDFLERLAPFSAPYRILSDPTPAME